MNKVKTRYIPIKSIEKLYLELSKIKIPKKKSGNEAMIVTISVIFDDFSEEKKLSKIRYINCPRLKTPRGAD